MDTQPGEKAYPLQIGFFDLEPIVQIPNPLAHLTEQAGLETSLKKMYRPGFAVYIGLGPKRPTLCPILSIMLKVPMQQALEFTEAEAAHAWAAAFNEHDIDRLCSLYDSQAVLWGTMSPQIVTSAQGVRAYFERTFQGATDICVSMNDAHVRSFGDVAVSTGSYAFALSIGGSSRLLPARFSFMYRRSAELWLIVDHHSSLMPSPQPVPTASSSGGP